jgi:uncharacterized damage-inducible protein DinB
MAARDERNPSMSSSQLTPEQAKLILSLAVPTLKNEHQTTKRVIEAIPLDKGDYRPDNISKTALELAWHIVVAENRFFSGISAGALDFTPFHRPESVRSAADICHWFDETFTANVENLDTIGGEQLVKLIDFRGLFQLPAVAFLQVAMNHTIHHRGQLSMYLRPMGAKVPAIYGESYDTAQARLVKEEKAN